MTSPTISVVVPFCSLEQKPASLLGDYIAGIEALDIPFEFLPVAHWSRHAEVQSLNISLSLQDNRVRPLSAGEAGWGRAVRLGVAEARGELICYTNPSRTSAEDLVKILHYSLAHSDSLIKGNRRIEDGLVSRFGSLIFVAECRALFDLAVWDINGTPKAFPCRLRKSLRLESDDDLIDLELGILCRREGYPIIEVSLPTVQCGGKSNTVGIRGGLRMYMGALRLWRQNRHR